MRKEAAWGLQGKPHPFWALGSMTCYEHLAVIYKSCTEKKNQNSVKARNASNILESHLGSQEG